jgi:Spy/CpxP family protein refolding chaperone
LTPTAAVGLALTLAAGSTQAQPRSGRRAHGDHPGFAAGGEHGSHHPGHHRGHRLRFLAEALDLTAEQREAAKGLGEDLHRDLAPLREELRSKHQELRSALEGTQPDPTTVGRLTIELDQVRDRMRARVETFESALEALLTPEQQDRLERLREHRHRRFRGGHHAEEGAEPGEEG